MSMINTAILQTGKFFSTHTGEIFTFPFINERASLCHKPVFFRTPETIYEGFVASFLGQKFSFPFSVANIPVLYGKLPNSHAAPPQSLRKMWNNLWYYIGERREKVKGKEGIFCLGCKGEERAKTASNRIEFPIRCV